jgi:hypothetical protein
MEAEWTFPQPESQKLRSWWRLFKPRLPTLVVFLLVAALVAVVLAPFMLVTVPRFDKKGNSPNYLQQRSMVPT